MACCGIPKSHESIVCFLDYLNFALSTLAE